MKYKVYFLSLGEAVWEAVLGAIWGAVWGPVWEAVWRSVWGRLGRSEFNILNIEPLEPLIYVALCGKNGCSMTQICELDPDFPLITAHGDTTVNCLLD